MSEDPLEVKLPDPSVDLDTPDGIVKTQRDFSQGLTMDLTDDEIAEAYVIIHKISQKYQYMTSTVENLEALRDEVLTRLAEGPNVLATFDPAPILNGKPPIVEFIGKVSGDPIHKHGMDHEKKEWEVKRANTRKEDFLGQKGRHA